ncbi:MAG: histidine phosphatase family protein [Polyangiales bacterium]
MNRATLLLARHGETDWNRDGRWQGATDIPLNEVGRVQARALADRLRKRRIVGVASSDLSRAIETADIVAASLGVARIGAFHALRERSYGAFEGLTRDECKLRFADVFAGSVPGALLDPPGAERKVDVGARVAGGLTSLVSAHDASDGALVVVAHGGAIRMFLEAAFDAHVGPLANGATFVITLEHKRFVAFEEL